MAQSFEIKSERIAPAYLYRQFTRHVNEIHSGFVDPTCVICQRFAKKTGYTISSSEPIIPRLNTPARI